MLSQRCKTAHGGTFPPAGEDHRDRTSMQEMVILIVDDDPTTRYMLQGILRQVGFGTALAEDGGQALTLARNLRPDLILLDVNLPDMDGFSVCQQVHDTPGMVDLPVLFISANDDISVKVRGFEAGGVDYITKPLAGREVIARVRTHLRLKHAYDALEQLHAERAKRLAATQQMIMPTPSSIPGARFAVALRQFYGAGGDFYDVLPAGGPLVDYVVADASGHDLETSFWTTAMKTLLQEHAHPLFEPADILRAINRSLCRILPEELFFTVLYTRLNRQNGRLTLVNGGHPPAICLTQDQEPTPVRQTGDVIGAFADADFETTEVVLRQGDRFLLYTDGLVESGGSQEPGITQLTGMCRRPSGPPPGHHGGRHYGGDAGTA